jgi:hypothetical protein
LLTNCLDHVQVYNERPLNPDKLMAIPISRHRYWLDGTTLRLTRRNNAQPLIDHVRELRVALVQAAEGERVDLHLTLYEPTAQLEQRHELSVALRNPVSSGP